MNYAMTTYQINTLPSVQSPAPQSRSAGVLRACGRATRQIYAWWQQRLAVPTVLSRIEIGGMSDHLLRDIGYIDARPQRGQSHRHH
ncbi:hypothetical protein [Collimonas sp.]|jgi:hypothetical protein|uniref:hypothetical protein n=1 Tax=Collimonas sp. TaxID=1963772 RepID=UPI0037C14293